MRSPGMLGLGPPSRSGRRTHVVPFVRVAAVAGERFRAKLIVGSSVVPCVLGPAGIVQRKREGDGGTPAGSHRLCRLLFRADRGPRPVSRLPSSAMRSSDGWCDDPRTGSYNRPIALPFAGGHERLWRDDRLYDLLVVLDYNLRPAVKGRGSAIFLHVRSPARQPTAGCVAVEPDVLRRLLGRVGVRTRMVVG